MTNLLEFRVTDFFTQVLATQYNRVIDATVRGEMSNRETLAANKTLVDADFALQVYDPTAARNVTLPAVAVTNHPFEIVNVSATYALTIKNAAAATVATVGALESVRVMSDGAAWRVSSTHLTATTQAVSDNSTKLATTAFVMAQRGDIPSGATLPASPLANHLFVHTPTGRRVLMLYTNSAWTPVYSFGTMTVYVDGASGTDAQDKGYGTGANAWATLNYAWSQIPTIYFGNVVVRTAAGTYAETLTCQGKVAGGAYSINIIGAETTTHSGTLTSAVQGTGATPGSITQTGAGWTTDQHKGDYVKTGTAYRVIESNTSDTLTICGTFGSLPSGAFSIVTMATIVGTGTTALMVNAGQAVYFTGMAFSGGTSRQVYPRDGARVYFNNCTFANDKTILIPSYDTYVSLSYCSIEVTANVTAINIILATVLMTGCLLWRSSGTKTGTGVMSQQNSNALLNGGGNVIDNFGVGVYTSANGATFFEPGATPGYNIIKNCSIGIQSLTGGQAAGKSNNQYSGNTTNEVATAASYGYNS